MFLEHQGPRGRDVLDAHAWDIQHRNVMQGASSCCLRQGLARMSPIWVWDVPRGLGTHIGVLGETLIREKVWVHHPLPRACFDEILRENMGTFAHELLNNNHRNLPNLS